MRQPLVFEGIENFREFGGYGAGTRRLKAGLLFRSAHHAHATPADLRSLAALDLGLVVDLRRPHERAREPSRTWPGFSARVLSSDLDAEGGDLVTFFRATDGSAEGVRGYMVDFYRRAPFLDRHVELFGNYFRALAGGKGAVLVHCAAGKDRTGILCALTHRLAGVHEDDTVADYLLTNDEERIARWAPRLAEGIHRATGRRPGEAAVRVVMSVEAGYLAAALDAIERAYGSVESYLDGALGIDGGLRDTIRARLLD